MVFFASNSHFLIVSSPLILFLSLEHTSVETKIGLQERSLTELLRIIQTEGDTPNRIWCRAVRNLSGSVFSSFSFSFSFFLCIRTPTNLISIVSLCYVPFHFLWWAFKLSQEILSIVTVLDIVNIEEAKVGTSKKTRYKVKRWTGVSSCGYCRKALSLDVEVAKFVWHRHFLKSDICCRVQREHRPKIDISQP